MYAYVFFRETETDTETWRGRETKFNLIWVIDSILEDN